MEPRTWCVQRPMPTAQQLVFFAYVAVTRLPALLDPGCHPHQCAIAATGCHQPVGLSVSCSCNTSSAPSDTHCVSGLCLCLFGGVQEAVKWLLLLGCCCCNVCCQVQVCLSCLSDVDAVACSPHISGHRWCSTCTHRLYIHFMLPRTLLPCCCSRCCRVSVKSRS